MIDLEEKIMQCWNVVDDLDYLAEVVDNNDTAMNIILGMKAMYHIKFEKLFDAYAQSLKPNTAWPFPKS